MKPFIKTILAASILAVSSYSYAVGTDADTANVSPAEKAKIEAVVHEYLLRKPEILVEAMQNLQQKQFEQAQETVKQTQKTAANYQKALFNQADDPIVGNPNGKITIVEFFDYQCPHCIDMVPTMEAIIKANPDVRVIYKEFPIRGPLSDYAARAALAARIQGKYQVLSQALLTANKPLTQETVLDLAKKVGLDIETLKKDINSSLINKQINENIRLAQNLKLLGTPAFFIGKTDGKGEISYVPGQLDQKQLQNIIDKTAK